MNIVFSILRKSQYRVDFEGIDTNLHPRQPMAAPKDHQRPYVAPVQKMETMTVTKVIHRIWIRYCLKSI